MSSAPRSDAGGAPSLLDELLAQQGSLSAVDRFARRHDDGEVPGLAGVYEERIPVGRVPAPGQQLAFRVDLDACTGCKACVTACHSMNGLAPEETWRDVGLLVGVGQGAGFQQTVTTACHHCEDPACLSGCPVRAYEKDPVTGIVRHLDDQCIGCQYCLLMCPYDVPQYNPELGIVRKCDMCAGRLAEGEAPACVKGCPNGAITIEIVDQSRGAPARELLAGLGGAIPDSAITRPTTRYVSGRPSSARRPAGASRSAPAPAHDPLAVMLVLMQLSVGTLAFEVLGATFAAPGASTTPFGLALAALTGLAGLGAATLHLGRPVYAYRAFLGWRTSWMSREILAFGAYVPAVLLAATIASIDARGVASSLLPLVRSAALALGLLGTACSIMIYVDTRRPAWTMPRTGAIFGATLVALGAFGSATAHAIGASLLGAGSFHGPALLLVVALLVLGAKVGIEAWRLMRSQREHDGALAGTARLLRGPLRMRLRLRFGLATAGILVGAAALAFALAGAAGLAAALSVGALAVATSSEFVERHLYFVAEASPGMPGQ